MRRSNRIFDATNCDSINDIAMTIVGPMPRSCANATLVAPMSTLTDATIHPSAILEGDIQLADDVAIGPHCVLTAPPGTSITLGTGTRLIGNVYLQGPLAMGAHNTIYPFVTLGFPPQDLKWDPSIPGAGVRIGSGNVFREHVTIHRATSHETPTVIGEHNYWMACSHAGHDAHVGD